MVLIAAIEKFFLTHGESLLQYTHAKQFRRALQRNSIVNQTAIAILQVVVQYGSETILLNEKSKVKAAATLKSLGLVTITEKSFQDIPRLVVTIKSPVVTI